MDHQQKKQLVAALLRLPSMSDPETRSDVVNNLRDDIKNNIRRRSKAQNEVLNIVESCLNYTGGVDELIKVLRDLFERDSLPQQALEKTWQEIATSQSNAVPEISPPAPSTAMPAAAGATGKEKRIFISYKNEATPDEAVAEAVHQALREHGYYVFIDKDMPVGTEWGRRIEAEIRQADFLIPFLSRHSVNSEMVLSEIEKAYHLSKEQAGRPVTLPVRVAYQEAFRYPLSAYLNHINWASWEKEGDTQALIAELLRAIEGQPLPEKRAVEPPPATEMSEDNGDPHYAAQPFPEMPEGTMAADSRFYIERPADDVALKAIATQGVTITIQAPRQMGKSSLLIRIMHSAEQLGKKVVFMDFQLFDRITLENIDSFLYQFCEDLTYELDLESKLDEYWRPGISKPLACTRYLERYILKNIEQPLLLALDEVDTLFDKSYRSDFFGMLRSWYNKRSSKPLWKQLDLALVTSTEPYQLIDNRNQSPFNVGTNLRLPDFSSDQVEKLNEFYGNPLKPHMIADLMTLLHGHPYLVRRALFWVVSGQGDAGNLFHRAIEEQGPFGDHLRYHLFRLHERPALETAMLEIIAAQTCQDDDLYFRLEAAGLVRREGRKSLPRCGLYKEYFRERLRVNDND